MKAAQARAKDVLGFLEQQRLEPHPDNYGLAYQAMSEPEGALGRAMLKLTDGGVRMTQADADGLYAVHVGEASAGGTNEAAQARDAVRHQTIRLAAMAADAASASGAFGRDLSAEVDDLESTSNPQAIVQRMIARAVAAEAEMTAMTAEVEVLRQDLETARDDALKDALTGLANRRAIDAQLARLEEGQEPWVIAVCDIDRFKGINDRYGHGVGDRVLKLVGQSIAATCNQHFVGRWGGEEFVVMMAGVMLSAGVALVDRARAELGDRRLKLRETDEPLDPVTFSAGAVLVPGASRQGLSSLHRADKLLYKAKQNGRNRVICA